MADLAAGMDDYEEAVYHDRRCLIVMESLQNPEVERVRTKIALANYLALWDPLNPEAEELIESTASALWVPVFVYPSGGWPNPYDEPTYLDVLQALFNLRLAQGNIEEAGDVMQLILDRFFPSLSPGDNITPLLSPAEYHATLGDR
ncbi:MAG: hypothetical protein Q8R28_20265 [Dehalococcoidia bacterium]|nr:hypothetical protein [Dehalococcoidia bacterium]